MAEWVPPDPITLLGSHLLLPSGLRKFVMVAAEEIPSSCFFFLTGALLVLLSFAKAQDIRRPKPCNPIIIIFCFLLY
jgi:hypothetical protein